MKNMSVGQLFRPLLRVLGRFQMTIFIIFVTAGLSVAVIFLYNIVTGNEGQEGYTSPIGAGSIDQATLERIKALHTSSEDAPQMTLPSGRVNPFGE